MDAVEDEDTVPFHRFPSMLPMSYSAFVLILLSPTQWPGDTDMTPRAKSRPEHLGRALNRTLGRIEGAYPDQAHRIWEVWGQAVGEPLASRCRPLDYRNGTLVLAVSSASWMQQVQFLTGTVRDTLNRALGENLVRQVRLRVAATPAPPPPAEPPPLPPTDLLPAHSDKERQQLERDLQKVADLQLRSAVRRARERAVRLARFKGNPEG